MSDASKELTLCVHDECMYLLPLLAWMVYFAKIIALAQAMVLMFFGSDICTCKLYLTYAMEESIRTAQKGNL